MGKIIQYGIEYGGGSNVVPNPEEAAEETLSKVQIDDTVYGIEGKNYTSGLLTSISVQNAINVNMQKSTPSTIQQDSLNNPNVLFFTSGSTYISTDVLTLPYTAWNENNQIVVYYQSIQSETNIIVSPAVNISDNYDNYCAAGIRAVSVESSYITFECKKKPNVTIYVNIGYWN